MLRRVLSPLLLLCSACAETNDDPLAGATSVVQHYSDLVLATYEDSRAAAAELATGCDALASAPSDATLMTARAAWLAAREWYLPTEAFRFYGGPIDAPDTGIEGFINAWPLDEAYIDYTADDPSSGIVNDVSIVIDAPSLLALNESGGETNIATGWHAVEFLLWGQDLAAVGPGARPATDYMSGGAAQNSDRRATYLTTVCDLLVTHHDELVSAWQADAYPAVLASAEPRTAIARILTGLYLLAGFETGGERIQSALVTGGQEEEHSCFSDNTHRDMVQDVRGIRNVYLGTYTRRDDETLQGASLRDLFASSQPELAERIADAIDLSLARAEALTPPFDREIAFDNPDGRARVQALADALWDLAAALEEAFVAFDLDIPDLEG
jgi:putative iron-regulated protein